MKPVLKKGYLAFFYATEPDKGQNELIIYLIKVKKAAVAIDDDQAINIGYRQDPDVSLHPGEWLVFNPYSDQFETWSDEAYKKIYVQQEEVCQ